MPIPLGILAAAGFSPAVAGGSYDLLETVSVGTAVASVEFTNLTTSYASTYQHLQIRMVTRGTNSSNAYETVGMRFNSDSGNNYSWHLLSGNGSSVLSENGTSQNNMIAGLGAGAKLASSIFVPTVLDLLDPFESKNKTIRHLTGGDRPADGEQRVSLGSGAWFNTASVTTINLYPRHSSNWAVGCRFSLYGVK